jgi:hypothetical protein
MSAVQPGAHHNAAYDSLARHPDPLLREIGAQLRDGRMRPRDVLSAGAYRTVMLRALERIRRESGVTAARGA